MYRLSDLILTNVYNQIKNFLLLFLNIFIEANYNGT